MIVIDSSAVIAILRRETDAEQFLEVIAKAPMRLVSSVNLLETSMVLAGRADAWTDLDRFIERAMIKVAPQDAEQVEAARRAFLLYGKGRHPARLNLGDCAAYALAKVRNLPLLFKGDDFSLTDLARASIATRSA